MSDHALPENAVPQEAATEHAGHREHHNPALAHHFETIQQQREAGELGMWLFLVTEFMFFGGLFCAYLVYRYWYPEGFAQGSHLMDIPLGTINTAVLLGSSFTMALAVHYSHLSNRSKTFWMLISTIVLGLVFLVIKAFEYHHKYEEHLMPFTGLVFAFDGTDAQNVGVRTFLNLYFAMTGLHAFHMVIGMVMMGILAERVRRGYFLGDSSTTIHNAGLYWHFVDLVWVYLFPFFYLVAARGGAVTGGH